MRWTVLPMVLAACNSSAGGSPAGDACGAAALRHLLGQHESALAAVTLPERTRFVGPGDAMTMDFNPERLNIGFDADRRIIRIWCG